MVVFRSGEMQLSRHFVKLTSTTRSSSLSSPGAYSATSPASKRSLTLVSALERRTKAGVISRACALIPCSQAEVVQLHVWRPLPYTLGHSLPVPAARVAQIPYGKRKGRRSCRDDSFRCQVEQATFEPHYRTSTSNRSALWSGKEGREGGRCHQAESREVQRESCWQPLPDQEARFRHRYHLLFVLSCVYESHAERLAGIWALIGLAFPLYNSFLPVRLFFRLICECLDPISSTSRLEVLKLAMAVPMCVSPFSS